MQEKKAIDKLEKLRNELATFIRSDSDDPEFKKWSRDTSVAIDKIFFGKESYANEFYNIRFSSPYRRTPEDKKQGFHKAIAQADALLRSMIDEIEDYGLGKSQEIKEVMIGKNVFIGHGRSSLWRELKDFINEKLNLPYDEFNRLPVAGLANTHRLQQMLDQASIAFLIMTAEDENQDGNKQARMNVIHEVGLFQGRLGFERAIVLLENGCEEFSNINGLGQIRFPAGNISAIFQDIRDVLEREKIII
ncbi:TIR domain-containing protein [Enterobacter roggenkampii]|uniref:TIR domain-containing protein n=1 Tax=Enterobacter roggenkampii TaxID=1812935 RepID=UPI0020179814|nr:MULTISPECIES: TIR domain-containing protein [Enterobacteriaceae]